MSIKLTGDLFCNAMKFNRIIIENYTMSIHNSNLEGYGFQSKCALKYAADNKLDFVLSERDYTTLAALNEFTLSLNNDVITVTSKNGKMKFPCLQDVYFVDNNPNELQELSIKPSDFLQGKSFIGNEKEKIQANGATIHDDQIIISDGKCYYIKKLKTGCTKAINIPKEVFKYLNDDFKVFTDGNIAVFVGAGVLFYTSLLVHTIGKLAVDDKAVVTVELTKSELLEELRLIKKYSDIVHISIVDNDFHLMSKEETDAIDIIIDAKLKKGTILDIAFSIELLNKVISMADSETTLHFNAASCFIKNKMNYITAGTLAYGKKGQVE